MVIRGEPFPLRTYQAAAVAEAERRNIICTLPTNSGKTIIAAAAVQKTLHRENAVSGASRRILFVVTTRELAVQQARVLQEQIPLLKLDDDESVDDSGSWRLGLLIGSSGDIESGPQRPFFNRHQVCVVIEAKLEDALVRGYLKMQDVALLVMDEAHHARGKSKMATIMQYFYHPCVELARPRVLALTASPVEAAAIQRTTEGDFEKKLAELEAELGATAWALPIDAEHCPHAEPVVLEHESPPETWVTSSETASFAYGALLDAKPSLEEAAARGLDDEESARLREAWDNCVHRALEVSEPFGPWALDWCARMLVRDLSKGARRLHWYEKSDDRDDESEGRDVKSSVGGTEAHGHLLRTAKRKLEACMDTRARAAPDAAAGTRLHVLLDHLRTRAPRKCLVFVRQRVSCSLLVDALRELLGAEAGWRGRIDWACRPGRVGISPAGRGSSTYADGQFAQALGDFRKDLRLLVSTSVLEEGIDVPECDAVVDFDDATNTRQGQQRKGRARAKMATYAYLVSTASGPKIRQQYENSRAMNEMTVELIARRSPRPPPRTPSAHGVRASMDNCVRTYHRDDSRPCALLPMERCKAHLDGVYCIQQLILQSGDRGFELDLTADGSHFTAKSKNADNFHIEARAGGFSCKLTLPGVLLCSANVGENLPTTLPETEVYRSATEARERAAREGVLYLIGLGVLDEHLRVGAPLPRPPSPPRCCALPLALPLACARRVLLGRTCAPALKTPGDGFHIYLCASVCALAGGGACGGARAAARGGGRAHAAQQHARQQVRAAREGGVRARATRALPHGARARRSWASARVVPSAQGGRHGDWPGAVAQQRVPGARAAGGLRAAAPSVRARGGLPRPPEPGAGAARRAVARRLLRPDPGGQRGRTAPRLTQRAAAAAALDACHWQVHRQSEDGSAGGRRERRAGQVPAHEGLARSSARAP